MTNEPIILFENDDVLVINKPIGLMVHEDGTSAEPTVVDWFMAHHPHADSVGELGHAPNGTPLKRSGVVHRLDRDTSGVLILAKTQAAHAHLKAQFHDRLVRKEYRAFVYGTMKEKWGTINKPIGRSASDFRKRSAMPGARGTLREAVTDWQCIGSGTYQNEAFSYLKLLPKTGRTHQLRVHLRAIERPIVGDVLYAEHKLAESNNLGLARLALHAHVLDIVLPGGVEQHFVAPVPQAFEEAAEHIAEG